MLLDAAPYLAEARPGGAAGAAPALYRLRAVVVHSGGLNGGHYTAFVRRDGDGWWAASDRSVRRASEEEALGAEAGAYLLFFEQEQAGAGVNSCEK
jgi:ubiquitin C-terminal hydrolase